MVVNSFKLRVRMELFRATQGTYPGTDRQLVNSLAAVYADKFYEQMRKTWHYPPHIVVSKEEIVFGDMRPSRAASTAFVVATEPELPYAPQEDEADVSHVPPAEGLPLPLDLSALMPWLTL